jgi:ribonuclease Z
MGAKNTLLTHFSARYPRLTPRSQARAPGPLMLATDGASVRIGDMWKMPLYTPAVREVISALTAGEEEEAVPNTDW